jgi:hypothetical protein
MAGERRPRDRISGQAFFVRLGMIFDRISRWLLVFSPKSWACAEATNGDIIIAATASVLSPRPVPISPLPVFDLARGLLTPCHARGLVKR